MPTVRDLISDALFSVGALGQGEPLSDADAQMCLRRLQRMLDSWANETLLIYAQTQGTMTLTANVATRSTSALSTGRPVSITSVFVTSADGYDTPLDVLTESEYQGIGFKETVGEPRGYYYRPSYPNGEFNFYPTPDAAYVVTVDGRYPLASSIALTTTLSLPPGYEAAICDNLAVDCAPAFGLSASDDIRRAAQSGKAWLKRTNRETPILRTNLPYQRTRSNIIEDTP